MAERTVNERRVTSYLSPKLMKRLLKEKEKGMTESKIVSDALRFYFEQKDGKAFE